MYVKYNSTVVVAVAFLFEYSNLEILFLLI